MEKLARILARQYSIEVVFEGSQAKTDGKKITLPQFNSMTPELKADLNGFLDHEVAHCKFTDFQSYSDIEKKFVRELANATEDIRIEREMVGEFAGTQFNLQPLRNKVAQKTMENWDKIPALSRVIQNVQWSMEGRSAIIDADIERYMDVIKTSVDQLSECKSTQEIIMTCKKIAELIEEEREEEKKEEKEEKKEESKGGKGDSKKSDKKESPEESDEEGKGGKGGEAEGEEPSEMDEMLDEKVGDKPKGESKFDEHSTDLEDYINEEIKDHVKTDDKDKTKEVSGYAYDASGKSHSVPFTTRFDETTDHSGKGNSDKYQALRNKVKPMVAPIKAQLERVLKVKENARWRTEREQGRINPRSLSKLTSDKGYRQIFRDFSKTETNNVAVEILVDMSGSMSGKMETAKMTTIAIAEALKELDIKFEITGFHSKPHSGVAKLAAKADKNKFNRTHEHLDLHVFKNFDTTNLSGIEKLFVGQQNPDGECVKWAASRLALRKEKRKILLVLSDGQPATGDGDFRKLQSDLKLRVQQIEKSGIECVGVGICTDAPKHFYKDFIIVNDVKTLPKEAMTKLAKLIGA